jgi:group I intron endonuclease
MSGQKVSRLILNKHRILAKKQQEKDELDQAGIYMIMNIMNNHRYIGQSKSIKERWRDHKYALKNNNHKNQYLQNAWNHYKEGNFYFSVLEFCKQNNLNEREQYWIERLKPEYNIVKNVFEWSHYRIDDEYPDGYTKDGETFTRPKWHLWVYGVHKKEDT